MYWYLYYNFVAMNNIFSLPLTTLEFHYTIEEAEREENGNVNETLLNISSQWGVCRKRHPTVSLRFCRRRKRTVENRKRKK